MLCYIDLGWNTVSRLVTNRLQLDSWHRTTRGTAAWVLLHLQCRWSRALWAGNLPCDLTRFKTQVTETWPEFYFWFDIFRPEHYDSHRFERVSNIIKQFKLSCSKTNSQFQCMEVRNSLFSSYIDLFTGNTYIMIIAAGENASTPTALTQLNIAAARRHFEKFFPENSWDSAPLT